MTRIACWLAGTYDIDIHTHWQIHARLSTHYDYAPINAP